MKKNKEQLKTKHNDIKTCLNLKSTDSLPMMVENEKCVEY